MSVDLRFDLDLDAPPSQVYPHVATLDRYRSWMPLVHQASVDPHDAEVWHVELRARVGPFARSKRLRMRRTVAQDEVTTVFERQELDRRRHAPWVLRAILTRQGDGTHVEIQLHYGGSLWGGMLERVLADQVETGRERLRALVEDQP